MKKLLEQSEWKVCPQCFKSFNDIKDVIIVNDEHNGYTSLEQEHQSTGISGTTPYHKKCFKKMLKL